MSPLHRARQLRPSALIARAVRQWVPVLLALSALVSCSETAVPSLLVSAVELTPVSDTVPAGAVTTLSARVLDENGTAVSGSGVRWSSSDIRVATVSGGVVTTVSPGTVRIAASSMGKSAVATITVVPRAVASLTLSPPQSTVQINQSVRLTAQPLDASGGFLTGRTITWSSSNVTVARVDATGNITGVAPGAAVITATCEGRTAQSAVTVTLPPVQTITLTPTRDTLAVNGGRQLTAQLRDASGAVLTGRSVVWSSNNVTVAVVSTTGAVTALQTGTAIITAASEGRSATATIVVVARLASSVTVTPGVATLIVGNAVTLSTQITDAAGNVLSGRPVSFTSEAPTVATVNTAGRVVAVSPGTARIVASSEGKIGFATIQVVPVPVATVSLTPAEPTLAPGDVVSLTLVARAQDGTVLTGRTIQWRSGAPTVASVGDDGVVRALSPGTALVLATVDGLTASSTIVVRVPPVASITLSPLAPEVAVGQRVQLAPVLRDANGVVLIGRVTTWSSSNEQVAFVSSSGQVVGTRAGTATITVSSEGVSVSTLVTVR